MQVGAVSLAAGEMVDVVLERGPADKPFRGFMIQTQDEEGNVVGEFSNLDGQGQGWAEEWALGCVIPASWPRGASSRNLGPALLPNYAHLSSNQKVFSLDNSCPLSLNFAAPSRGTLAAPVRERQR